MPPVIDDRTFANSDQGLPVPARRQSADGFALRISNLDHADPPPPYRPGGVPREPEFNANVVTLKPDPAMPAIGLECEIAGFDPATTPIRWRLQTLYVVGRYRKVSSGENAHYRSRVLSLGDTWTAASRGARFQLFED